MTSMSNNTGKDVGELKEAPPWMWAIGLLGLVFVLGSIGFMLYEAAAGDSSPPDVKVEVQAITSVQNGFLVEFRVINQGGTTAAGLAIEGQLRDGTTIVETSNTTVEYVPSHSERQGGLFFRQDPQLFELQLRAKGYETP